MSAASRKFRCIRSDRLGSAHPQSNNFHDLLMLLLHLLTVVSLAVMPGEMQSGSAGESVDGATCLAWTVDTVAPGVVHSSVLANNLYGSPQSINVLEIGKEIPLALGSKDKMESPVDMAKEFGAVAAVNGSFFDMSAGNSLCYLKRGTEVCDTTTTHWFNTSVNGAVLFENGKLSIIPWSKSIEVNYCDSVSDVLASGPVLLSAGTVCAFNGFAPELAFNRHPRTAVGVRGDGSVIFVCVDGRNARASGMTLPELADLMKTLGAEEAMNLDGGGSSMMWTFTSGVVSYPCGNGLFDHFGLRNIPNIIYIPSE